MTAPLLSQSRPRFRLGLALVASALLHGAAVALATLHHPAPSADITSGNDGPIVFLEPAEPPTSAPPREIPDLPPPPIPDDPPLFTDATPPTPRQPATISHGPIRKERSQYPTNKGNTSARALALHAPLPAYPYEARRARITGNGVALLSIDPASGQVTSVTMAQSTGSAVLDNAAISGLRRWRFRPGTRATVRSPITYTLTGAAF
ncbi:MAG: energy transducer TonB [Chthoniobacterales bacterium]